jgi:hypothetical protein
VELRFLDLHFNVTPLKSYSNLPRPIDLIVGLKPLILYSVRDIAVIGFPDTFHFELRGWLITFHKVQGKTLERIILCLDRRKGKRMPNISFTSFLVGFSRVRSGDHIRRLGTLEIALEYLTKLKEDPRFQLWMSSFDEDGIFNLRSKPSTKKRSFKEVYSAIQGQNWGNLNVHQKTIRRWRAKLSSINDIEKELEDYGQMEFALFMRKRFKGHE